jgi:hypothetical protein
VKDCAVKCLRRVKNQGDLVITTNENILIIDNGCDQSIINQNSFLTLTSTGTFYNIGGALCSMTSDSLLEVVDACTLATLPDGNKVILRINQALMDMDPKQHEALIQPHQMRT